MVLQEPDPAIPDLRHERLVPADDHAHRDSALRRERAPAREAREVVEQVLDDALGYECRVCRWVGRAGRDGRRDLGDLCEELRERLDGEPEDCSDALGRDVRDGGACAAEDGVSLGGLRGEVAAQAEDGRGFLVGEPV